MADEQAESSRERSRACAYCNKSKTRCRWAGEPGVGSCVRCSRLNRPCQMPEVGERRKRGPSTRVGQLEEKIDGIMSLLNASRHLQQTTPSESHSSPAQQPQTARSPTDPVQAEVVHAHQAFAGPSSSLPSLGPINQGLTTSHSILPRAFKFDTIDIVPNFSITAEEADRYLDMYRTSYSPQFPFVPIPPTLSTSEFFEQRPFLFKTIIQAVAPQSAAVQRDATRWFREYIAHHMIVNQERRLELLQSILVFIVWGDFHFYVDSQGTNLIQLAVGLVSDLGLNRPPQSPDHVPNHMIDAARLRRGMPQKPAHTLEEMRALLGCFYLASTIALLFRRLPMFPYTGYLGTCCEAVFSSQEFASDKLLAALIYLQKTLYKVDSSFLNPEVDTHGPAEFSGATFMLMSSLRGELDLIRGSVPVDVQPNPVFNILYCCSLMRVYEPAIYMRPPSAASDPTTGGYRTEALWSCLQALKLYMDSFMTMPLSLMTHQPLPVYSAHSFAMVTMTRILFLNSSDWDLQVARKSFNLPDVTARLIEVMDAAERLGAAEETRRKRKYTPVDETRSILANHRDKIRWIRSWYMSKLVPADQIQQQVPDVDMDSSVMLSPDFWSAILDLDGTFGGQSFVES